MKKTKLDHLLERYITGKVTDEERTKIEAWLDLKKSDEGADLVLDAEDEERLFAKITSRISDADEIKSFRPREFSLNQRFSVRWLPVAATLLLLLLTTYIIRETASPETVHEIITKESPEKVILDDGTIAWLQEHSHLTYVKNQTARQASLLGEGLFEVAKDPETPFIIRCGVVQVKVLGTSFYLKSSDQGVELKVLTGLVNVSSIENQAGIEVVPLEMARISPNGEIIKSPLPSSEIEVLTAETEYPMQFKNTTMDRVLRKIEHKFNVNIILEDERVNRCRLTADLTDNSLVTTFNMIAELLEIRYEIEGNTITVVGTGCN